MTINNKNIIKRVLFIFIFIFNLIIFTSCEVVKRESAYITTSSDKYEIVLEEKISFPIAINNLEVTYSASEEGIVSIDNNIITGINPGSVVINAMNGSQVLKKYVINVKDNFASIEIFGESYLPLGATSTYSAVITPNKLSQEVIWESSDSNIIVIDENGVATAVGEGLAHIEARSKEHPSYYNDFTILVTIKNDETKLEYYSNYEDNLSTNLIESIFYPIIEDSKSYVIGVSAYQTGRFGVESNTINASGIVYKRMYILNDGTVTNEVSDLNNVTSYRYYAITNRHIVKGMSRITVTDLETSREISASVVQYDLKVDVAVITFDTTIYFKCAKFGDSDEVKNGDFVIAVGSPFNFNYKNTATIGIVSNTTRYLADDTDDDGTSDWDARYIQHDASINDGNNGGPLINLKGEVIGLNTLKISSVKTEDMGFAIPSNTFSELIDFLENGIQINRPILGVMAIEIRDILVSEVLKSQYNIPDEVNYGIYISEVSEGVAQIAGVKPNDILLQINGKKILHTYILRAELNNFIIGSNEECEIVIYRDGQEITMTIIF